MRTIIAQENEDERYMIYIDQRHETTVDKEEAEKQFPEAIFLPWDGKES